jgi:hypothetical protein
MGNEKVKLQPLLDAMVAVGSCEEIDVAKMHAAALLWLDCRRHAVCELSAEDGEWPDTAEHELVLERVRFMKELIDYMRDIATRCFENERLVWEVLTEQARRWEFSPEINW